MFVKKSQTELEAISKTEVDAYFKEKDANDLLIIKKAIDVAISPLTEKLKIAQEDLVEAGLKITDLQQKGGNSFETFESQILKGIEEKFDDIQEVFAKKSGVIELVLKVPGTVTTASGANILPPAITGTQLAPIQNINLREMGVIPLTTNLNTSLASYPYTEATPKDGDFGFVAEGTVKPQIDFNWSTEYAKPKKVAAWLKLTDESVKDVVGLQSIATDFLRKKHNLKKSKGILFGDGLLENPKGATTYGRGFSAGPLALAVDKPNFMDVINAAITDIATTHNYEDEMPYMANLVLINPVDFYIQIVSAKTTTGIPLYPTASLFNQLSIGGVTIVPEESIPTGKIFVADMSKYNTTNYVDYVVKIGYVNDDFIKNQFVILGESRFHAFVKKLDEQAFIYDNYATIKTAITKP